MQTCSPFYGSPNPADCDDAYDKLAQALGENFTPEQPHGSDEYDEDFRIGVADELDFVDRSDYAWLAQRYPAVKLIPMPFTVFTGRESLQIGQDHRLTAYQVPVSLPSQGTNSWVTIRPQSREVNHSASLAPQQISSISVLRSVTLEDMIWPVRSTSMSIDSQYHN